MTGAAFFRCGVAASCFLNTALGVSAFGFEFLMDFLERKISCGLLGSSDAVESSIKEFLEPVQDVSEEMTLRDMTPATLFRRNVLTRRFGFFENVFFLCGDIGGRFATFFFGGGSVGVVVGSFCICGLAASTSSSTVAHSENDLERRCLFLKLISVIGGVVMVVRDT